MRRGTTLVTLRAVEMLSAPVLLAAGLGGLLGIGADRLSAIWPSHENGARRRPDWRTLVVALGGALSFGALTVRWTDPRDLAVLGIFVAALIVLLATDLDQMLLPDLITLPLIGYAAAVTLLGLDPVLATKELGLVSAVAAAVLAPLLLAVSDRIFRGALGGGDLKLSVSLGLMAGLVNLLVGFLAATIAFAAVVLVLLATRRVGTRTAIPFGPALIAAGVVALVLR